MELENRNAEVGKRKMGCALCELQEHSDFHLPDSAFLSRI
jgi:hypothetical protein